MEMAFYKSWAHIFFSSEGKQELKVKDDFP